MLTFNDTEEKAVEKAIAALAVSLGRVFTKAQIFEAVWSMGSEDTKQEIREKVSCFFTPVFAYSRLYHEKNTAAELAKPTPSKPGKLAQSHTEEAATF